MKQLLGRFVWFDLMTPDIEGAKSFYDAIAGWEATASHESGYNLWKSGGEEIGGVMGSPEEGIPPHWMGHVAVEDVDAIVEKAKSLGGKVIKPGTDIPNVGRFAILADPQGAAFSVFGSDQEMPTPDTSRPGMFSWSELNTTDWEAAWKFYSQLFGWRSTSTWEPEGGDFGTYFMFGVEEGRSLGGMSNAATMMKAPAHWLYYFNVADIDQAVKTIEANGGKVLNGPMEIPGNDKIAQCMDPQGAYFAIYASGSAGGQG